VDKLVDKLLIHSGKTSGWIGVYPLCILGPTSEVEKNPHNTTQDIPTKHTGLPSEKNTLLL
jgi:hypothetical protein